MARSVFAVVAGYVLAALGIGALRGTTVILLRLFATDAGYWTILIYLLLKLIYTLVSAIAGGYLAAIVAERKPQGAPHDALYWRLGGMMAIRKGDWKLVKTREGPLIDIDPSALHDLSEAGLYNLSEDIGETRNRAAERPDKVRELSDLWQQWNRHLSKPLWEPRSAF